MPAARSGAHPRTFEPTDNEGQRHGGRRTNWPIDKLGDQVSSLGAERCDGLPLPDRPYGCEPGLPATPGRRSSGRTGTR